MTQPSNQREPKLKRIKTVMFWCAVALSFEAYLHTRGYDVFWALFPTLFLSVGLIIEWAFVTCTTRK